jgi:hypothetical protein
MMNKLIQQVKHDLLSNVKKTAQEIIEKNYDEALKEWEGDEYEAAFQAVHNFLWEIADAQGSNKAMELISDPEVLEFPFYQIDKQRRGPSGPGNLKNALPAVVMHLLYTSLEGDERLTERLGTAVLELLGVR